MPRQTPRNFVPLDSNYPRDVAIQKAGPMAELLFVRSLAFCKLTRSAGFVSHWDIDEVGSRIRGVKSLANVLVKVGLWEAVDDGWRIRSWDRWNGLGEAESAGGKQGNHTRWHVQRDVFDPGCTFCAESESESGGDRGRSVPDRTPRIQTELNTSSYEEVGGDPDEEAPRANREDVEALCAHLERRIAQNGVKNRKINNSWRTAARLLLDKDARPLAEAQALIDWCQNDSFWRGNILSMPTFREKYDQLRLRAMEGRGGQRLRVATVDGQRTWSKDELDAVLGADGWSLPAPPRDLPDAQYTAWARQQTLEHRAERIRQAEAKWAQKAAQ